MVYKGDVYKASGVFVVGGCAVFESKEDVVGVYDVGHIFAELEGIFYDGVHFFFVFAVEFVELV